MRNCNEQLMCSKDKTQDIKNRMLSELQKVEDGLEKKSLLKRVYEGKLEKQSDKKIKKGEEILKSEEEKEDSTIIKFKDKYRLREQVEEKIKKRIKKELENLGFDVGDEGINKPKIESKEDIRKLHAGARKEKYEKNKDFLEEKEDELLSEFADGLEIDLDKLWPRLEVIEGGTYESDLFRYATLLWSVPVSQGFGRRVRFIVWDEHTDKIIGIFALGDPVFNLSCRDDWINWGTEERKKRLYNVMDIFILGAVPPYNTLLGGKLIAMLATSNKVRNIIYERYKGKKTVIQGKDKDPRLALLTTSSALGKSALYDRIRYNDRVLYKRIGESKGWGHFHLNKKLFYHLRDYLKAINGKNVRGNEFGDGPNWKMRTTKKALQELGLSSTLLRHGIHREIYGIPLAKNFDEFLRGDTSNLNQYDIPFEDIAEWWKERWLYGRAKRKPEYVDHKKEKVSDYIHSAGDIGE